VDPQQFPTDVDRWAALRTAARWEKKLADGLAALGVPVYLPLMTRLTSYKDKRRAVQVPVFGGYVFCSEPDFLGNKAITPGVKAKVAQVLRPPDPAGLKTELAAVADLLTDRELVQERLVGAVGDVVRIVGGPLTGYQGTIVRVRPNKWQVVLAVSFLGARLEVEVDERLVEKSR
jgi:transcription antitermination factor NusG